MAGTSYCKPLHGELFFCDQSQVDKFVENNESSKTVSDVCNNFVAGSVLRSANRYHALEETAVFGYCCRHEFPGEFVNLKHGERLAYAVWMLERIVQKRSGSDIFVMYDIACTLFSHLKSLGRSDILSSVNLRLPTFHSYGHKVSCQVKFGPRRCEGLGLSDGETMERLLWSYLRRFARMTKEMRPAHRIDVLSSALVYYGILRKEKLASLLLTRFERAISTKIIAQETFNQLLSGSYEEKERKVKKLIFDETAGYLYSDGPPNRLAQWKLIYFQTLHMYYSMKAQLSTSVNMTLYSGQLLWLNKCLLELERKHQVSQRWLPSDAVYKECEHQVMLTKKEQLLVQIWKASQRRMFLLNLKKKWTKIAKRICRQISKETKCIQSVVEELHACQDETSITLQEALDPSYVGRELALNDQFVSEEQHEAIQAYLTLCRSAEEIDMLRSDAGAAVAFYEMQKKAISDRLLVLTNATDAFSRGCRALLQNLLAQVECLLGKVHLTLQTMTLKSFDLSTIEGESDDEFSDSEDSFEYEELHYSL